MYQPLLSSVLLGAALVVSGCAATGPSFSSPDVRGTDVARLGPVSSVSTVASQLAALGLSETRRGPSFVEALGNGAAAGLIDCGTITQSAFGNTTETPAVAPTMVVYTEVEPPRLVVREFEAESVVQVSLSGEVARLNEQHTITVSWENSEGDGRSRERRTVGIGEVAAFSDG